jgi:hypothetical protein
MSASGERRTPSPEGEGRVFQLLAGLVAPAGSSITYSCVLRQGFRRRAAGGAVRVLMFQTTRPSSARVISRAAPASPPRARWTISRATREGRR